MSGSASVVWVGLTAIATGVGGIAWAFEPVAVPIVWLLILTFIPTRDMVRLTQRVLDATVEKAVGKKKDEP